MKNLLQQYFPLIRTEAEALSEIRSQPRLAALFQAWDSAQQREFLDFCTGVRGVKTTYDAFFKEALNPEYDRGLLDSLLSSLLGFPVHIVSVLPNDSTRIEDESSLLITDIVVELEDGSLANVEIQKIGYAFPGERCACYSADLLLRQYRRVRSEKGKQFSYRDIKTVWLIVLFEKSHAEMQAVPEIFLHRCEPVFSSGLQINLLQNYILIGLDIFRKGMQNKAVGSLQEAWLMFLGTDEPERIVELITAYPEFRELYGRVYQMCRDMEDVMGIFSEELRILDRNTVKYMIDELHDKLEEQEVLLADQAAVIADKDAKIADKDARIAELERLLEGQEKEKA